MHPRAHSKLLAANNPPRGRARARSNRVKDLRLWLVPCAHTQSNQPPQAAITANSICPPVEAEAHLSKKLTCSMAKLFEISFQTTYPWLMISQHCILPTWLPAPQENKAAVTSDQARPLFCAFSRRKKANITGPGRACALPAGRGPSYASCAESSH